MRGSAVGAAQTRGPILCATSELSFLVYGLQQPTTCRHRGRSKTRSIALVPRPRAVAPEAVAENEAAKKPARLVNAFVWPVIGAQGCSMARLLGLRLVVRRTAVTACSSSS